MKFAWDPEKELRPEYTRPDFGDMVRGKYAARLTKERGATKLETAPHDHEPESAEEAAAVKIAWQEHAEGKCLSTEELKRALKL